METINKAVDQAIDTISRTIYGPQDDHSHDQQSKPTGDSLRPTEHQLRDEATATSPLDAENRLPTQGPGQSLYLNKPIVTTTNETSKLTDEAPHFQNLSLRSGTPPTEAGHRRNDSGHAEAEGIAERFARPDHESGAHVRYGHESREDDGVSRTADQIDSSSHTTEGYARQKFVGNETSDDGISRKDGRERVQFDDSTGSSGNLRPSGEPSPERPRQGSSGALPYINFGDKGGIPKGARIGTVQGGTFRDRHQGGDLGEAQEAQSGGFGGTPAMFGTGSYDSTGTSQVQQSSHSIPHESKSHPSSEKRKEDFPTSSIAGVPTSTTSSRDSDLHQNRGVTGDSAAEGKLTESHPLFEKKQDIPATSIPGVPTQKPYSEDRDRHEDKAVTGDFAHWRTAKSHPSSDESEDVLVATIIGTVSGKWPPKDSHPPPQSSDWDYSTASSIPGVPNDAQSSRDSSFQKPRDVSKDINLNADAEEFTPISQKHLAGYHHSEDNTQNPTFADDKKPSTTRPDAGSTEGAHPPAHASITPASTVGPQRGSTSDEHPSSSNEPLNQGGTTNPATTNAIDPMGPGLTQGTHGPVEPSVGANPAYAQQDTQKHQGGDRPLEEPSGHVPQLGQDHKASVNEPQEGDENKQEAGHKWVKSSGTVAEGGDFDAAKPGAGREADRLLEQAGIHRTLDPRQKKTEEDTKKVAPHSHAQAHGVGTTSSGNPANPTHHPDSAADAGGKSKGLHMPGILHHHDRKKDTTEDPAAGGAHKGLTEKIKEKITSKLHKE